MYSDRIKRARTSVRNSIEEEEARTGCTGRVIMMTDHSDHLLSLTEQSYRDLLARSRDGRPATAARGVAVTVDALAGECEMRTHVTFQADFSKDGGPAQPAGRDLAQ